VNVELYRSEDFAPLITLWCECFDDSPDIPRAFYDTVKCNVLAAVEDKKTVGMANLIPVKIGDAVGVYLYAVCVAKKYRGCGIFRTLLNYAEKSADFVCLIPENETVADTYRRHGYTVNIGRYGRSRIKDKVLCNTDFAEFAKPDEDFIDNAFPFGLLKPITSVELPKELCFNTYMGEV
jgi:GNAT superfamily N-acetyltransferase